MPSYTYDCPVHGEFDADHSINTKLEFCPKCEEEKLTAQKVKRLISNTSFILVGGRLG